MKVVHTTSWATLFIQTTVPDILLAILTLLTIILSILKIYPDNPKEDLTYPEKCPNHLDLFHEFCSITFFTKNPISISCQNDGKTINKQIACVENIGWPFQSSGKGGIHSPPPMPYHVQSCTTYNAAPSPMSQCFQCLTTCKKKWSPWGPKMASRIWKKIEP